MKTIKMGNPHEVKMLLKHGAFLDMSLVELQREHAELIAFNTMLDRERNDYRNQAKDHKARNELARSVANDHFIFEKDNPELTIKAMRRALIGSE